MKKFSFSLMLSLISLLGCNEDWKIDHKDALNYDQLAAQLQVNTSFTNYVVSKANNIVVLSSLSDKEKIKIESLEKELFENGRFDGMLEFYNSIGYDIKEFTHFLKVKKDISVFSYEETDLLEITKTQTIKHLNTILKSGVISIQLSCSIHCEEVTALQYASAFDGVQSGSIEHYLVVASKGDYFRGCYHECVLNQE